jgi:putative flippase GtrA
MSWRSGTGAAAEVGRFFRANLSSTIATGIEWALVTGLLLLGLHYLAAAAVGAATGAVADFSLKRHWAFDRLRKGGLHHEGFRYLLVSAGSLLLNLLVAYLLVERLGSPKVPGVIGASLVVGVLWNYPLHRNFVFRSGPAPAAGICATNRATPTPTRLAGGEKP